MPAGKAAWQAESLRYGGINYAAEWLDEIRGVHGLPDALPGTGVAVLPRDGGRRTDAGRESSGDAHALHGRLDHPPDRGDAGDYTSAQAAAAAGPDPVPA